MGGLSRGRASPGRRWGPTAGIALAGALMLPELAAGSPLGIETVPGGDGPRLGEVVQLRIRAPDRRAGDLEVRVEGGTVGPLHAVEGGFVATWTLPAAEEPRRFAAAVIDAPSGELASVTAGIARAARFSVEAPEGASVVVRDGHRTLEESVVGPGGAATIDVVVQPGAILEAHIRHGSEQRVQRFGAGDQLRVWVVPVGAELVADPTVHMPLFVIVYRDSGEPLGATDVAVEAGTAPVAVEALRDGLYRAEISGAAPDHDGGAIPVLAVAHARGGEARHVVSLPVEAPGDAALAKRPWALEVALGVTLTDRGAVSPSAAIGASYRTTLLPEPHSLSPVLVVEVDRFEGTYDRERMADRRWFVPVTAGVRYRARFGSRLSVAADIALGVAAVAWETERLNPGRPPPESGVEAVPVVRGRLAAAIRLGPGDLELAWTTTPELAAVQDQPMVAPFTVALAYAVYF